MQKAAGEAKPLKQKDVGLLSEMRKPTNQAAKLRQTAKDFEAVFLFQMLKQMRSSVQKEDLFHGGMGEDMFTEMMDEELSKKMAGREGVGIAEMLYEQLSRQFNIEDVPDGEGLSAVPEATRSAQDMMQRLRQAEAEMRATSASGLTPEL